MDVTICEGGLRDGLQNEAENLEPSPRAEIEGSLGGAEGLAARARRGGSPSVASLSVAFGCPFEVAAWLEGVLGHELPGRVYRAGNVPAVS